ncbi:MAG: PepSY domain-containing protein [Gammaproteobacteria bacterium]
MQLLRRTLILLHRYIGIPLSVLFVLWFVTGIAMIYVGGMPALDPQARLERLSPLDIAAVHLAPAEAAARAERGFGQVRLTTILGRPAYRFDSRYGSATVFADDGETLPRLDVETAKGVAAKFLSADANAVSLITTVNSPDQWTLALGLDLPLYKFAVSDGAGTEVYVSPEKAEVRLVTTRRTRTLAWIATIPHWFYITPLRSNQPAWYWTVVIASGIGCVLALLGIVLGVVQLFRYKPVRWLGTVRYQGWMWWHQVLGLVFGVFALTWVFSGLLSMEPFDWTNAEGLRIGDEVLSGGPVELDRFAAFDAAAWAPLVGDRALKELEFKRVADRPYYLARFATPTAELDPHRERLHQPYQVAGRAEPEHVLIDATTLVPHADPFTSDSLLGRLAAAAGSAQIVDQQLLRDYDSYYYSRGRQAPLPVLRVKFDDPLETWLYVDVELGQIVATIHRLNRLERWLYNGLHSLDFGFWYDKRPLWDIGMITLSLGALVMSSIGLWFGLKRVKLDLRRLTGRRGPA